MTRAWRRSDMQGRAIAADSAFPRKAADPAEADPPADAAPTTAHDTIWLTTAEVALLLNVTQRSASRILSRKRFGQYPLRVKAVHGQGGRKGKRLLIDASTLPEPFSILALRVRDAAALTPPTDADQHGSWPVAATEPPVDAAVDPEPEAADDSRRLRAQLTQSGRRDEMVADRLRAIMPLIALSATGSERADVIQAIARGLGRSPATLRRWLRDYERHGIVGLVPALRDAKGVAIVVSRRFDALFAALEPPAALVDALAREVDQILKDLWASPVSFAGVPSIQREAETMIRQFLIEKDFPLASDCDARPARCRVERFKDYALVHVFENDAVRYRNIKPRIHRSFEKLAPMDCVFVDVKHIDVRLGGGLKPRAVCFYDQATGRMFSYLVAPASGAVSAEHVELACYHMMGHPDWGIPRVMYADQGSENSGLIRVARILADRKDVKCIVKKAQPHNPQAKPIEGIFSNLNKLVFARFPGFTGGKPYYTASRVRVVGEAGPVFPGTWEDFCRLYELFMTDYHHAARGKKGSPHGRLADARSRGAVNFQHVPPGDLEKMFSKLDQVKSRQSGFVFDGQHYTSDEIFKQNLEKLVTVCTPDEQPPSFFGRDDRLYKARHDPFYEGVDGYLESQRRKDAAVASVRDKKADVRDVNLAAQAIIRGAQRAGDAYQRQLQDRSSTAYLKETVRKGRANRLTTLSAELG